MSIDLIYDIESAEKQITNCIQKHGYFAEHSFTGFKIEEAGTMQSVFLTNSHGYGALGKLDKEAKELSLITGLLAPEHKRLQLLKEIVSEVFANTSVSTIEIEAVENFKKEVFKEFKGDSEFVLRKPKFVLYWPVFEFEKWNGDLLEGKNWKKMRNILNKFYKNRVKVVDSKTVPTEKLLNIIKEWKRKRKQIGRDVNMKDSNRIYDDSYYQLINSGFQGLKFAKTMTVNGEPCSITAGWEIPNSKGYYSRFGVHNFKYEGLGEAANMEDLARLKKAGYDEADFGGSSKALLAYKMKYRPSSTYKTYTFNIVKN